MNLMVSLSLTAGLVLAACLCGFRPGFRVGRWTVWLLLGLTAAFFLVWRDYEFWFYSDAPFHLALIGESAETGKWLMPGDPFFHGYATPLHHSLVHVIGAGLTALTGSVTSAWTMLGVLYLALAVVAAWLLGRAVFVKAEHAAGFAVLFVVMLATAGMIPNPSTASELFCLAAFALVIGGGDGDISRKARKERQDGDFTTEARRTLRSEDGECSANSERRNAARELAEHIPCETFRRDVCGGPGAALRGFRGDVAPECAQQRNSPRLRVPRRSPDSLRGRDRGGYLRGEIASFSRLLAVGAMCGLAVATRLLPGLFGYALVVSFALWCAKNRKVLTTEATEARRRNEKECLEKLGRGEPNLNFSKHTSSWGTGNLEETCAADDLNRANARANQPPHGVLSSQCSPCLRGDESWCSLRSLRETFPLLILALAPLAVASPWLANMFGQMGALHGGGFAPPVAGLPSYWSLRMEYVNGLFRTVPFGWLKWLIIALYVVGMILVFCDWTLLRREARSLLRWIILCSLALFLFPWGWASTLCGFDAYRTDRLVHVTGRILSLLPPALFLFVVAAKARETGMKLARWKWRDALCRVRLPVNGHDEAWPSNAAEDLQSTPAKKHSGIYAMAANVSSFGILFLVLFGPAARIRMRIEAGRHVRPRFEYVYQGKEQIFGQLKGKTVLSDAWTSYMTKYALGFYCVTTPVGHSSPLVDVARRTAEVRRFFAGKMGASEASGFLRRHDCDYVLVNRKFVRREPVPDFDYFPEEYEEYSEEYMDELDLMEKVYEDEDVELWRVGNGSSKSVKSNRQNQIVKRP